MTNKNYNTVEKNQILFNVEGETFKIKIGEDLDLEEVYTVLLSALCYLEDLALDVTSRNGESLH